MAITTYTELQSSVANWLDSRTDLTTRITEFIALAEDAMALDKRVRCRAMETQGRLVWAADLDGGTVGGTANAITLSAQTGTPDYAESYTFVAGSTNTGAVTVNSINLQKSYGGIVEALAAGDIRSGQSYRIYYDGTRFLVSPSGGALVPTDYLQFRSIRRDASDFTDMTFLPPDLFWRDAATITTGSPRLLTIEGDWAIVAPSTDTAFAIIINYYRRLTRFSTGTDTNWNFVPTFPEATVEDTTTTSLRTASTV